MPTIRLGGVPEHFNYPWHFAIINGYFQQKGIEIEWHDYPGGTGAMALDLRSNRLDMALLLTEGAIREISDEAPFKIVGTFVESPLTWGIHTASANQKANTEKLGDMKYAISRKGSGSHLMAYVHAYENGSSLLEEQMIVVHDLKGAITSLQANETDLFLWEKFTTKPYIDAGKLKRIGEFPSPWPCFVLVAREEWLFSHSRWANEVIEVIHDTIRELLLDKPTLIDRISSKYTLAPQDVSAWLEVTKWSLETTVSEKMLQKVQFHLSELGLSKKIASDYLVHDKNKLN